MRALAKRRLGTTVLVLATGASILAYQTLEVSLRDTSVSTGLLLLFLVTGLVVLNARKKLPFFPVLRSVVWMQVHIYAGWFAAVAYGLHAGIRLPNGGLEITLAALFWVVILSGAFGLFLVRTMPRRMRLRGEPVLFERHPLLLRQLRHRLAAQVTAAATAPSIADFHARRLVPFFAGPRDFWQHLLGTDRSRAHLLRELEAQTRYLNEEENTVRLAIARLIEAKSDLDYYHAHQSVLKYWLFVHIPVSYSLLITGALHGLVAYTWGGPG